MTRGLDLSAMKFKRTHERGGHGGKWKNMKREKREKREEEEKELLYGDVTKLENAVDDTDDVYQAERYFSIKRVVLVTVCGSPPLY